MSLTDEERDIIVTLELEKAVNTMAQIPKLQQLGYWDNIANRLYYAVFHAVNALLINDGHLVNTHRGLISLFGNYYIRTGIFFFYFLKLYSNLQTIRNNSDYNCSYNATQQEIEPMIAPAQKLITKISDYIKEKK